MAENSSSSPVFAGRYRFQPVGDDWDRGRSGFTHLVFDTQKERLGVIKRAEIRSQQAVEGLKNEIAALLDLKGHGVPEVYDTGEAEYGSKTYFYMVIEYIEGIRVEKNLDSLTDYERAEILMQFFGLLAKANQMGIVNGDIDLKHLFWRRDKRQLIVIDWGNAKLDVDPKRKSEFAYDLARAAEILYSFTTLQGSPPTKGSLSLPDDSKLIPGLVPLPVEFRNICKWAPRIPADSMSPHAASELFEVSKRWSEAVQRKIPYQAPLAKRTNIVVPILGVITIVLAFTFLGGVDFIQTLFAKATITATETQLLVTPDTPIATLTPTPTGVPAKTVTQTIETPPTQTSIPATSPTPGTYTNAILVLDPKNSASDCWINETNLSDGLNPNEGFYSRVDRNWGFKIEKGRTTDEFVQTDFSQCLEISQGGAIALNAWVPRLELQRDSPDHPGQVEPGKEFGFFIEDGNGQRREYTLWIDKERAMRLRIREGSKITFDDIVSIVDSGILKIRGSFPRFYAEFPIQVFLEINNNELDIIYLKQGPVQAAVKAEELDPHQMIPIPNAVRPALGSIQKIGLIGYGGETQTVIWPLVFFGK